jgi:hypothetical protein
MIVCVVSAYVVEVEVVRVCCFYTRLCGRECYDVTVSLSLPLVVFVRVFRLLTAVFCVLLWGGKIGRNHA